MIKKMPIDQRPREKLLRYGVKKLSTAELIAILISSGTKDKSAIDLANEIITKCDNSIKELTKMSVAELKKINGIGLGKASTIKAAVELSNRMSDTSYDIIRSPMSVYNIIGPSMKNLTREHFKVLILDSKNRVISIKTLSIGTINYTIVHPRDIFHEAIRQCAKSIIIAHNHPSGDVNPSKEDIEITKKIVKAGDILGIRVLDHIIVGDNDIFSLKENGYME